MGSDALLADFEKEFGLLTTVELPSHCHKQGPAANLEKMMNRREFLASAAALALASRLPFVRASADPKLLEGINRKKIPSDGASIPVMGMGTWITFNVGQSKSLRDRSTQVLAKFFDYGGGMVDSSPMYGSAEEVIGYASEQLKGQYDLSERLFSASKIWTSSNEGIQQFNDSKRLWKLERFDLFQIHNLVNYQEHIKTLKKLKGEGAIKYLGITTSHGRRHSECEALLKSEKLDFIQLTYNITHREVEERLLKTALDQGVAVIANRPYDGGELMKRYKKAKLPSWAAKEGIHSWADFMLKFIVSHPAVTCAIPATSKVSHMIENMEAAKGKLPGKELRAEMIKYLSTLG